MERVLIYLAVTVAVASVLLSVSKPRPQIDYCTEARRLASDIITVYQSGGRVVSEYRLRALIINGSGVFCGECGISVQVPSANSTAFEGRVRLTIAYVYERGMVSVHRVKD